MEVSEPSSISSSAVSSSYIAPSVSRLLIVSIPLIIGNLGQNLLQLLDTAMVSVLGERQLAATTLALNVYFILFMLVLGMGIALTPLVAQARGGGKTERIRQLFHHAVWLTGGVGLMVSLLCVGASFLLPYMDQPAEIIPEAQRFLWIVGLSAIPAGLFFSTKSFADGMEATQVGMLSTFVMVAVNAGFNYVFITGRFGMPMLGIDGAAIGTVLGRVVALGVVLYVIIKKNGLRYALNGLFRPRWNTLYIKKLFQIGIPSTAQYLFEVGAFAVAAFQIGRLGVLPLAAHSIAIAIASFTFMVALGISSGAGIMTGQAMGQGSQNALWQWGRLSLFTILVIEGFFAVALALSNRLLPTLFHADADLIAASASLITLAGLFQLSDGAQAIGVGMLRGVGDVKIPTAITLLAYWVIATPVGAYLCFVLGWGAPGIWWGLCIGLTVSAVLLNFRYFRVIKKLNSIV